MKQQSLKEFLEGVNKPVRDWEFDMSEDNMYDFQAGQYDLAQEILSMYFTESNYED